MKKISDNKIFRILLFLLTIAVISKSIWFIVSILFLPQNGVEHIENAKLKPLYYRVKLVNRPRIVKNKKNIVKVPAPQAISIKGITLIAIYDSKDMLVVTVKKANKTTVLSKGENIDGFKLKSGGSDYAVFRKANRDFKLILEGTKIKNPSAIKIVESKPKKRHTKRNTSKNRGIIKSDNGEEKIISKGLLTSYTKDIDKIWKDIGIGEHKKNGILDGFMVNFVKKGSDFEKLGLRRGDILKSINGQELNSYNAAFSFYKEIGNIESLTLSIIRNNQDMELEYEIH